MQSLRNVIGFGQLIEDNIKDILCEVCMVFFEVDVVFFVICEFIVKVKEEVLG